MEQPTNDSDIAELLRIVGSKLGLSLQEEEHNQMNDVVASSRPGAVPESVSSSFEYYTNEMTAHRWENDDGRATRSWSISNITYGSSNDAKRRGVKMLRSDSSTLSILSTCSSQGARWLVADTGNDAEFNQVFLVPTFKDTQLPPISNTDLEIKEKKNHQVKSISSGTVSTNGNTNNTGIVRVLKRCFTLKTKKFLSPPMANVANAQSMPTAIPLHSPMRSTECIATASNEGQLLVEWGEGIGFPDDDDVDDMNGGLASQFPLALGSKRSSLLSNSREDGNYIIVQPHHTLLMRRVSDLTVFDFDESECYDEEVTRSTRFKQQMRGMSILEDPIEE